MKFKETVHQMKRWKDEEMKRWKDEGWNFQELGWKDEKMKKWKDEIFKSSDEKMKFKNSTSKFDEE